MVASKVRKIEDELNEYYLSNGREVVNGASRVGRKGTLYSV